MASKGMGDLDEHVLVTGREGRCAGTAGLSGWKLVSIRDSD